MRELSLVAESGGCSLVAVLRLLLGVASLVENRLKGSQASVVAAPKF